MKKSLLFDTAINTSNMGDEIIYESVKKGLYEILYNTMNFRLGTHIENYSPLQLLYRGNHLNNICGEADYKFICGTNLLSSDLIKIRPQFWVNQFNKVLYENAVLVGVGTTTDDEYVKNKYTERIYKYILSDRYYHSVRDEKTKRFVENLGFKAINTGCPTLWGLDSDMCKKIPRKKAENVIFTVSGYIDQQNEELDRKMLNCIFKEYKRKFAYIQTAHDEKYLTYLLENKIENVEMIYSLEKYKDILINNEVDYIGTRLHGGIFALQHGVRSIIISIDHRALSFYESNNLPILKREEINHLKERFFNDYIIDIKVDKKAINDFLIQFKE